MATRVTPATRAEWRSSVRKKDNLPTRLEHKDPPHRPASSDGPTHPDRIREAAVFRLLPRVIIGNAWAGIFERRARFGRASCSAASISARAHAHVGLLEVKPVKFFCIGDSASSPSVRTASIIALTSACTSASCSRFIDCRATKRSEKSYPQNSGSSCTSSNGSCYRLHHEPDAELRPMARLYLPIWLRKFLPPSVFRRHRKNIETVPAGASSASKRNARSDNTPSGWSVRILRRWAHNANL